MHELSIAESIIGLVSSEAEKSGFHKVLEIRLKIGEYSGIIPECIREFFPIAAKGTAAEGAELVITPVTAEFLCRSCSYEGPVSRMKAYCPQCGSADLRMIRGRELFVEDLKVE